MKLTQQQRLRMALESLGATPSRETRKYLVMTRNLGNATLIYYLGNAGSLRIGRSYTQSVPVADRFKTELLAQVPATITKVGKCRIIPVEL